MSNLWGAIYELKLENMLKRGKNLAFFIFANIPV